MENPASPNVSVLQSDSWSCLQHQSHVMFTRERVSVFQRFLFAFLGPFKWHSLSQTLCSHRSGFSLLKGLLLELCSSPTCSSFLKHFLPGSPMLLLNSFLKLHSAVILFKAHVITQGLLHEYKSSQRTWHPFNSLANSTGSSGMV